MHRGWFIAVAGIALIGFGGFLVLKSFESPARASEIAAKRGVAGETSAAPPDRIQHVEILPQATFSTAMLEAGVSATDTSAIYATSKDVYDLAYIRAGKTLDLHYDSKTDAFTQLVYAISTEEELYVTCEDDAWNARRVTIAYEVKLRRAEGTVESSLYEAALKGGVDERAVIAFADVFQWTVDFAQDVRVGDTFKFVYEERYRDGAYVMPGNILAAEYVNDGEAHRAYLFTDAEGEEGYYDEKGTALRKLFLKAPVAFKYITSGFTTGRRYVSAFNTSTGHRAIDYAAKVGTPIRATADGTVVFAGWDGPYGNKITIRHNGTYTTNYCHQSRFAVKKGQKVSQGQIIGYVGSTGFSTGPHLHYEMVKNGTKINPLREVFPGTDPVKPEEMSAFQETVAKWKDL